MRTELVPLDVSLETMRPILLTSRTIALLAVPAAFAVMVAVSSVTSRPLQVARTMVRLHTPEDLTA